jgi:uncharacterized ferritin-like protein (DUF455 family)
MPYTAWAWRVLTGDTLADKLAPPEEGGAPPTGALPDVPGRPRELALPARGETLRAPFPADHTLHEAEARGRALHFFANHELLALEVMALALVRFRDAPPAFRRGLVGILADEQRHLAGYLERMARAGVRFGDLPVNRYFWDALAGADPLGLVAGLSLTFEQANLDFAAYYAEAFRKVGDDDTARVLDGVLADEIRHVKHGLAWFDRWRPPGGTRWDAWVAALPHPLTPARARGTRFYVAPREAAGLDADTILRVRGFGASKGRPPRVYTFHPEVEADIAGLPPSPTGERVRRDLAGVLLFLAGKDDLALVPRAPTPGFLAALADAGFELPEVVEGGPDALAGRTLGGLAPWGWGPAVCDSLAGLGAPAWQPALAALYDKGWAAERLAERPDLCDPAVVGRVCRSWDEVCAAVGEGSFVLKAPLSTAGRGLRRWSPDVERWAREILATQGSLVVEPWLDRALDLSVQFDVGEGTRVAPWGRFLTDAGGRYRGAVLGDVLRDQPSDVRRCLHEGLATLEQAARHVGDAMRARGFTGPAGIDALVYRTPGGVALKPIVELNPRNTMGRVARAIGRRVRRDRVGLWTQVSREDVRKAGYPSFPAWAAALRARAPLRTESGLITSGALLTTDSARAERIVTALVVGDSLEECRAIVGG